MKETAGFVTVARVGEIPPGGVKVVRIEDQLVAVFHVDGAYYAIDDVCTHDGGPLAEGVLEGNEIVSAAWRALRRAHRRRAVHAGHRARSGARDARGGRPDPGGVALSSRKGTTTK